jgi:hypothetical protein
MHPYPQMYLSTDGMYDRAHRIWTELTLLFVAYPIGFAMSFFIY